MSLKKKSCSKREKKLQTFFDSYPVVFFYPTDWLLKNPLWKTCHWLSRKWEKLYFYPKTYIWYIFLMQFLGLSNLTWKSNYCSCILTIETRVGVNYLKANLIFLINPFPNWRSNQGNSPWKNCLENTKQEQPIWRIVLISIPAALKCFSPVDNLSCLHACTFQTFSGFI